MAREEKTRRQTARGQWRIKGRDMDFTLQTCRILHDEHMAKQAFLDQLERFVAQQASGAPPDTNDPGLGALLARVIAEQGGDA